MCAKEGLRADALKRGCVDITIAAPNALSGGFARLDDIGTSVTSTVEGEKRLSCQEHNRSLPR